MWYSALQVDGVGHVKLSKALYYFTDMQDLWGAIGYKVHCNQKGQVTLVRLVMALYPAVLLMASTPLHTTAQQLYQYGHK